MANSTDLDQFYTKSDVAKHWVSVVDSLYGFDNFDKILEPSAGAGSIYNLLPENRIGIDIDPKVPDVIQEDFLKWYPYMYNPLSGDRPNFLTIGNPPFGKRSKLALQFFYHASLFSDVICFIVPRNWMLYEIQKQLPPDFGLYHQTVLHDNSFTLDGEDYPVRCVAQCWSRFDPMPSSDQCSIVNKNDMISVSDTRYMARQ